MEREERKERKSTGTEMDNDRPTGFIKKQKREREAEWQRDETQTDPKNQTETETHTRQREEREDQLLTLFVPITSDTSTLRNWHGSVGKLMLKLSRNLSIPVVSSCTVETCSSFIQLDSSSVKSVTITTTAKREKQAPRHEASMNSGWMRR